MKPIKRKPVSKPQSASQFKKGLSRTKAPNVAPPPMRGGYRF